RGAARDGVDLAKLLERVDANVRVRADADADTALAKPLDGSEAVAEVRLGGGAQADAGLRLGEQVELGVARLGGVDDGRARTEAAGGRKQLDRPEAVLGEAFVHLTLL